MDRYLFVIDYQNDFVALHLDYAITHIVRAWVNAHYAVCCLLLTHLACCFFIYLVYMLPYLLDASHY